MKVFKLFLVLLCCALIACKKEKPDIQSRVLNPYYTLHPVDSFDLHPSGMCQEVIPFPTDSTASITLDVDQDGNPDFKFTYTNQYQLVSENNPCANYNSVVKVQGINPQQKIAVTSLSTNTISPLPYDENISTLDLFSNAATIYRDDASLTTNFKDFNGDGYIAIQLANGSLGWIKLRFDYTSFTLEIQSVGYNKTSGSALKAGQTN